MPRSVLLRRAIRLLGASRRLGHLRGGPLRDRLQLRALDALAEAGERLSPRAQAHRTRLAGAVAAAGLRRLEVFSRPRSRYAEPGPGSPRGPRP